MAQRPDPEVKVGMGDGGGAELHLPLLRGALAGIIRYPHSHPDGLKAVSRQCYYRERIQRRPSSLLL